MIDQIIQALTTVGPVGFFFCLIVGGGLALAIVLGKR